MFGKELSEMVVGIKHIGALLGDALKHLLVLPDMREEMALMRKEQAATNKLLKQLVEQHGNAKQQ